ncbi:DUF6686 family protein [Tenacibaculum maritimum]|uniref:DUF6686 family protein n=2 Tax=Tenacibaculum maritimum TaxID=107401 RepID=UPI0012E50B2F|nr:DUF6686 family protein [Tenacibaculum maritimum]MDB0601167.1 hypothetical protein [Tenacibaculum maritimum]MDB0613520.1 hypothetical protein [Tenacibaculum maritimum]CAA0157323.1 conserved hypothetical protein [Tenacibaculum maritimum]CAA0219027.1 conserved hypothetical protein [Tenacibaculum maritimum]
MENINRVYNNEIGISFFWRDRNYSEKVQIIFKDIGFHLTTQEIEYFNKYILEAKLQERCSTCEAGRFCRSILLKTPSGKVSMAVSLNELELIEDLLSGTLFQLNLSDYLKDLCKN